MTMTTMVNQATSTWDSEDVTLLRTMWCAGNSASVIGLALHRSRNAIIGKVKRMKLQRENEQPTIMKAPTRSSRPSSNMPKGPKAPPTRREPAKPVPYLHAKNYHCRAVLDQRGSDGLVMRCGERRLEGSAWCRAHYLAYRTCRSP